MLQQFSCLQYRNGTKVYGPLIMILFQPLIKTCYIWTDSFRRTQMYLLHPCMRGCAHSCSGWPMWHISVPKKCDQHHLSCPAVQFETRVDMEYNMCTTEIGCLWSVHYKCTLRCTVQGQCCYRHKQWYIKSFCWMLVENI